VIGIRNAYRAICARLEEHATSDAAAAAVGGALVCAVVAFTIEGRIFQFAFAFMAGMNATAAIILTRQPIIWAKLRELRENARDLAARSYVEGYGEALRDIEKAISGGDSK